MTTHHHNAPPAMKLPEEKNIATTDTTKGLEGLILKLEEKADKPDTTPPIATVTPPTTTTITPPIATVTPPTTTTITPPATSEVVLTNSEKNPSNWKILPGEDGTIEAYYGSHVYKGTTEGFNKLLSTGKYTK
jgi:hypothetical protein